MYEYEYPRPALTVDCVVFSENREVLLIERGGEPYKGCLANVGGFVNIDEKIADAAYRELFEESNISFDDITLHFLDLFDEPNRDSRGRVIAVCYVGILKDKNVVKAGDDAVSYTWKNPRILKESDLAFDHWKMIQSAYMWMYSENLNQV